MNRTKTPFQNGDWLRVFEVPVPLLKPPLKLLILQTGITHDCPLRSRWQIAVAMHRHNDTNCFIILDINMMQAACMAVRSAFSLQRLAHSLPRNRLHDRLSSGSDSVISQTT